jgi:predicted dehydrogenase
MQWFKGDRIKSISTFATGWHTAPQFRQEDTSVTMCQLESGKLIRLRLDCISHRPHNMTYYTLQGTKGSFEAPRGLGDQPKVYLLEEGADPNKAEWRPLSDFDAYLPERYRHVTPEQSEAGHWGGDYFIVKDFVDAIRGGTKPPIDVYDACEWTSVALLSELSVANGGRMMDVPDFRKASGYRDQFIKL